MAGGVRAMSAANNPRLVDAGAAANRARARAAARRQVAMAGEALRRLQALTDPAPHQLRWIQVLQLRVDHPDHELAQLAAAMRPAMTKSAYAALLRRALRNADGEQR